MQWHPIFAKMLRPIVQEHYDVQTGMPVGDAPRAADIVLIRRTSDQPPPYRGLLHHLTTWNVLEFKGRSVSPRVHDLDLLVELGLGVDRRLNEERIRQRERPVDAAEVSFWYIANHLGRRYLHQTRELLGDLGEASPGVWRSQVLRHPLFLVDGRAVPVDRDSVAIHLVGEEAHDTELALAHVIVEEPGFWELYAPLLRALHPNVWKEASSMAKARRKKSDLDLTPLIEEMGLEKYLSMFEVGDVINNAINTYGPKKVAKALGVDRYLASISAEERLQLKERLK